MRIHNVLNCNRNNDKSVYFNKAALSSCGTDNVAFSGLARLCQRYKIKPDDIEIFSSMPHSIDQETKKMLVQRLLEAHEHARKNVLSGNKTKSGYATNICLADGAWGEPATNFNDTSVASFCGERSAVLAIFNRTLKGLSLRRLEKDPSYQNEFQNKFKARFVVMSSAKPIGTDNNAASPCADCLSWFNSDKLFQDNTQVVSFSKDEKGQLCLKIRTIKELLPYRNEKNAIIDGARLLGQLEASVTPSAALAMKEKNISLEDIMKLLKRAKSAQATNKNAEHTQLNIASAVMTNERKIKVEKKFDWTKRWFIEPAELASLSGVKNAKESTKIDAIAYYGNGIVTDNKGVTHSDGVVSLQTLGRLRINNGGDSTLVVSVVDNKIMVRTIDDYMPKEFRFIHSYLGK